MCEMNAFRLETAGRDQWKSLILEHFRAVEFKIFFNHGESIHQQSAIQEVKIKIYLNHGESIPQQSIEILRFRTFQSSRTQNFLQPW